jgi:threonine dehydrogenase-like Zn-dependent dehydrogenase
MRRATWTADGLEVVEVEPGPLADGWVRLQVEACGICGTDLHFWHGEIPRPVGTAPGHEFVATVLDGPAGLADVLYAVSPNVACGACDFCRAGQTNLCARGGPGLGLGRDGALAEVVDAPAVNLAPVGGVVDPVVASLTEPLAVALRGVSLGDPGPDSRVLVLGGGTIGLCAALVARERAGTVAITTRYPHQRTAAEALGVTVLAEDEAAAWGKEHRPDVVVETVGGRADTMPVAITAARRGGRIVVVGAFSEPKPIDLQKVMMKEVSIHGSFCYGHARRGPEFAAAAGLVGRWHAELAALTTHQLPLDQVTTAFETAGDKSSEAIKVTIVP